MPCYAKIGDKILKLEVRWNPDGTRRVVVCQDNMRNTFSVFPSLHSPPRDASPSAPDGESEQPLSTGRWTDPDSYQPT